MGRTHDPSKCWVFKTHFSFKVRQHSQQQLYRQHKGRWILYKMVRVPSISQLYLRKQPMFQSSVKTVLQLIFISLFHPYLFTKSSLQSPLILPSSISQQFYTSFFVCTTIPTNYTKMFSLPQPLCQFRLPQATKVLGGLLRTATFFLKVWTGLTITDSLSLRLWKLVYCRCGKPSNPPCIIPSASCLYFHTLITPPQVKQPVA